MRRVFALILTALFFAVAPASAQEWPVKAVKIVVPFAAGSTPDVVARLIADELQQKHHGPPLLLKINQVRAETPEPTPSQKRRRTDTPSV